MKNLVFSMLAMAAMVSCTSESDPINEITDGDKVEIKLNAGIVKVDTKAAIESNASSLPTSDLANVFIFRTDAKTTPDWTTITPNSFKGTIKTDGTITADPKQYYPTNGDNTYLAGLFLGESATQPTITTGKTDVTITGEQDILWAAPIDKGVKSTPLDNATLAFKHQLTQFKFVVKNDATVTEAITGIEIKIQNANTTTKIALNDGTFDTWSTPISTIGFTGLATTADLNRSTATNGVMLEPNLSKIVLKVSATDYTKDQEITIEGSDNGKFEQGKAYTITLTFKAKEISGKATVAPWTEGTATGGDVI